MSQFVKIIVGGLEIAAGVALDLFTGGTAGNWLIEAGAGQLIGGIGSLLNQPQGGVTTASRNPIAPWVVVYGRAKVGGTIVYINEFGEDNKYLDLIFVLACHPCQAVDAVLFDNQRILFESSGKSKSPTQSNVGISSITRSNGVVTVVMSSGISDLQAGDQIQIQDVSGQDANDRSLNGKFYIATISGSTFTYLNGGLDVSLGATGSVQTVFADYANNVYFEALLGDHTETFDGMLNGTPITDKTNVKPEDPLGLGTPNPWTAQHKLLGRTSVFLRLHYTDVRFSNGLPQISFRLRGKNDILDVRTSSTGYSENPALCIGDFLRNQVFGFKASTDEVPSTELASAANICDEDVTLASGGTEPRYTLNGSFPLSMKRGEILQNMLTSCGGRITYQGGEFVIHPAAWVGPSFTLGGPPILSASVSFVSSFTPPVGYDFAYGLAFVGTVSIVDPPVFFGNTAWTKATNTIDLDDSQLLALKNGTLHVHFSVDDVTQVPPLGDATEPAMFDIYQVWIDVTFEDLTTARWNPDFAEYIPGSTGSVTDPDNAIDDDADTFASIQRSHFSPLGIAPILGVSAFKGAELVASPPSLSPEAVTGSLNGLAVTAGAFRWKSKLSIRDLYNGVKGTFISPANGWQISDYPPYAQDALHGYEADVSPMDPEGDANMAADGGERRWLDLQLPFTISPSMAQRLAKIELLRRRQQGTGTFVFNMSLYQTTALDVIAMDLPLLGWSGKLLEIEAHRLTINKQQGQGGIDVPVIGCELDVQETDATVYDWSTSEELSPQGFQQSGLPDTSKPEPPTDVTLTSDDTTSIIGADGIARSRILVQWVAPADGYVLSGGHIEIQYKFDSSPDALWISVPNVDPTTTQAYIDGVTDGIAYDVQIRSVNAAGVPSDWVAAGPITVSGASSAIDPDIITQDGATTGQGLVWDGSHWVPTTLATAIELQTGGTDNGSQTKLNLVAGTNITITDDGAGDVTISASASGGGGIVPTTRSINTTAPLTGGGDLSADRTLAISDFTGDSGSGGAKGAVPAPAAGDAAAGKFLKADGTWDTPSGGSSSSVVIGFSIRDGSTGTAVGGHAIAPRAASVAKCKIVVDASDASTDLTFTIKQNGTSIFSADPTVTAGTSAGTLSTSTSLTSSPLSVAADDLFTLDISSGGTAWKFTAQLET